MAFVILMVGLFLIMYMQIPIFDKKAYDYTYLAGYLAVLTLNLVNDRFGHPLVSQAMLLFITTVVVLPLLIKFISNKRKQSTK